MRDGPLRAFFYSNEGDPREPPHVHFIAVRYEAKFWLTPEVSMACDDGLKPELLSRALRPVEDDRAAFEEADMIISPESIRFDEDVMWADLSDGRTIGVPLAWFSRLLRATSAEREAARLSRRGLHWEAAGEDVSVASLLAGQGTARGRARRWHDAAEGRPERIQALKAGAPIEVDG